MHFFTLSFSYESQTFAKKIHRGIQSGIQRPKNNYDIRRSNGRGFRATILWTIRYGCNGSRWPITWATFCGKRAAPVGATLDADDAAGGVDQNRGQGGAPHSKKVVFQMMEVAVPRELFWSILQAIGRLCLARHGQRMNEKHQSIRVTCRCLRLMRLLGA